MPAVVIRGQRSLRKGTYDDFLRRLYNVLSELFTYVSELKRLHLPIGQNNRELRGGGAVPNVFTCVILHLPEHTRNRKWPVPKVDYRDSNPAHEVGFPVLRNN